MQLTGAPAKLTIPFANGGGKNTIPVASSPVVGAASFTDGFPAATRMPIADGGTPPSGLDMNGIGYQLSNPIVWFCAGAGFPWDSVFSTNVGGYPKGARVLQASGMGYWLCLVDNNTSNPDTGGAGWTPEGSNSVASVHASAQQNLAQGSPKVLYDTVEFDSQSMWDSSNKRFLAKWDGNYRISGSTFLAAPAGQNLAVDVWKNGGFFKRGFEYPQVSDVDLSLPFNIILALNTNDYVEVYMSVPQTAVAAGPVSGDVSPFVYAQFEYLGK